MIRVFVCPECGTARVVSKFLHAECFRCGEEMQLVDIPYTEWVELSSEERDRISEACCIHEKNKV